MILAFGLINIIAILTASMVLVNETDDTNRSDLNNILQTEQLLLIASDESPLGKL